ncbi:hypothetical protein [Sphingobium sp. WCS2017Hpa-17]|uniref:hypothetical protein n=1 Tax=Sphingobium sp. WCS2017Hpa-17 TaxID=3073638 RepID=UPI00288BEED9|nr:hypothetical protein [Sphingobium sp. WCS2017Hpa-17]
MLNRGAAAVRRVDAWTDSKGQMHPSKDKAIAAELTIALGGTGAADGMAPGLVGLLLEKRETILPLLTEYGAPEAAEPDVPAYQRQCERVIP